MNEAAKKQEPEEVETTETSEGGRERSTIAFPYLPLDDAVEVAKAVHTVGGQTCQWDQLAAQLQQAANGGGFRMRVQTAKLYGLLTYDRGTVTLTPLGTRICDPEQEKAARVESFLTIPLYKAVYDQFKNGTLPPSSGLETAMGSLGVAPKQKERARQVFQRSATQAGFFAFGTNKLVMPSVRGSSPAANITSPEGKDEEPEEKEKPDKPERKRRDPLIEGLIDRLPEDDKWDLQGRRKWLMAALSVFDLMYKDSEDNKGTITIEVERNSAK